MTTATAILVAAGRGVRLGAERPKALVELSGSPLAAHAAARLADSGVVGRVIVALPPSCGSELLAAVRAAAPTLDVVGVVGGASRQASVAAALAIVDDDCDVVLVHDAARALAPPGLIARVVETVRGGCAAVVPALPVTDTITSVGDAAGRGSSSGVEPAGLTLARSTLRSVQTPQGFDARVLARAHAAATPRAADERTAATDDASLVSDLGEDVWLIAGDPLAIKITTTHDLRVAALLLEDEGR